MNIVYEDNELVVINKPAGLLTVPGLSSPENAYDQVRQHFPNSRIVHRLDMATSGLVIFPQSHQSLRLLGQQFEQRKIYKTYTAVVYGLVNATLGEVALPLCCDWQNRPRQHVHFLEGKTALTGYEVIARDRLTGTTRLKLKPYTGRSHQLRVHMQQLGHPILGDAFYAHRKALKMSARLLLHATELSFLHPITSQKMMLHAKPEF